MTLKIQREPLLGALQGLTPGLTKTPVLEQSDCFVFDNGMVQTFNEEIFCSCESPLEGMQGAVPARKILDLLEKLNDPELKIDYKRDSKDRIDKIVVKGNKRRATFVCEPEIRMPLDAWEAPGKWIALHEQFTDALGMVRNCAGSDRDKFFFTCVHLHPDFVEACDNIQMTRYDMTTGLSEPTLVRATSARWISQMGMTRFSETPKWLHFRNDAGLTLSCRRFAEKYPELGQFLKIGEALETVTFPASISDAAGRAQVFSEDNQTDYVGLRLKDNKVLISGTSVFGSYEEVREIDYSGREIAFSISPKLLLDLVSRTTECLVSEDKLMIDGGSFKYVACLERSE